VILGAFLNKLGNCFNNNKNKADCKEKLAFQIWIVNLITTIIQIYFNVDPHKYSIAILIKERKIKHSTSYLAFTFEEMNVKVEDTIFQFNYV
jgi:hypothetical protein